MVAVILRNVSCKNMPWHSHGCGHVMEESGELRRVPQVGIVEIGDDVEIGANTTVDRATLARTVLRDRVKLDNLIQLGHNSELDEDVVIAAQSGIRGDSCSDLEDPCLLSARVFARALAI